jgi:uncharacterized Zn finger protein (UPF0148 family)
MPFCPDCGTEHQGARFCPNCGIPQPGTAASGAPGAVATPSAPPIPELVEEEEETVWEGEAKTVTKAATRGHLVAARYRLTSKVLHFQEGALSTKQQQVPLWAVRDIDVERSLTQKARGIGTVTVWVEHSDYTGRDYVDLRNIENASDVGSLINRHAKRERLAYDQRKATRYYGQTSPGRPGG